MKKLIIFDLDGTLLNTIADLATATNYALHEYGYATYPIEDYKQMVGNGINKLFERALPEGEKTEENVLKIRSLFVPFYDEHNADLTVPYSGIEDMLTTLRAKGYQFAVASNKYQAATSKLIAKYFPTVHFCQVYGQREGIPTKPAPDVIFEIMNKTGVSNEHIIYVGDSNVDMLTGRNADVTTIGVSWGFRGKAELQACHPDFIADNAEELKKIIFSL